MLISDSAKKEYPLLSKREVAEKILHRDPATREAILNASYKDLLALRVISCYLASYLNAINKGNRLQADAEEGVSVGSASLDEYNPAKAPGGRSRNKAPRGPRVSRSCTGE